MKITDKWIGKMIKERTIRYQVSTFTSYGLEAKWSKKQDGRKAIYLRNPNSILEHQRETWWLCNESMLNAMKEHGILKGFSSCTVLGDIFSIPA